MLRLTTAVVLSSLLLAACSPTPEGRTAETSYANAEYNPAPPVSTEVLMDNQPSANTYLAYEHSVTVSAKREQAKQLLTTLIENCQATSDCAILESEQSRDSYRLGRLVLRAPAPVVAMLLKQVQQGGDVNQLTTRAEDLSGSIMDTEKRLAQLRQYRSQLDILAKRADNNVEALIQIHRELAEVQSQIEDLSGQSAYLIKRVKTELLTVDVQELRESQKQSSWSPISNALDEFVDTLASSFGSFVIFIAVIAPWLLIIIPSIWGIRKLWRRRKQRLANKAA